MKVELTVKAGWSETTVVINGERFQVERIVEAIMEAYKVQMEQQFVQIK